MVRYVISICLFVFAFNLSAHAAINPAGVQGVTLGGSASATGGGNNNGVLTIAESSLCNSASGCWFTIYAGAASSTDGRFHPFWRNGVQYQVSSGKVAFCVSITDTSGSNGLQYQLVSATASFAADASSLTGPVYQGGAVSTWIMQTGPTGNLPTVKGLQYSFAAQTYPGVQIRNPSGNNLTLQMLCKEI